MWDSRLSVPEADLAHHTLSHAFGHRWHNVGHRWNSTELSQEAHSTVTRQDVNASTSLACSWGSGGKTIDRCWPRTPSRTRNSCPPAQQHTMGAIKLMMPVTLQILQRTRKPDVFTSAHDQVGSRSCKSVASFLHDQGFQLCSNFVPTLDPHSNSKNKTNNLYE